MDSVLGPEKRKWIQPSPVVLAGVMAENMPLYQDLALFTKMDKDEAERQLRSGYGITVEGGAIKEPEKPQGAAKEILTGADLPNNFFNVSEAVKDQAVTLPGKRKPRRKQHDEEKYLADLRKRYGLEEPAQPPPAVEMPASEDEGELSNDGRSFEEVSASGSVSTPGASTGNPSVVVPRDNNTPGPSSSSRASVSSFKSTGTGGGRKGKEPVFLNKETLKRSMAGLQEVLKFCEQGGKGFKAPSLKELQKELDEVLKESDDYTELDKEDEAAGGTDPAAGVYEYVDEDATTGDGDGEKKGGMPPAFSFLVDDEDEEDDLDLDDSNEEVDEDLSTWLKKLKSGPTRLVTGDKRYESLLERGYKLKMEKEWKFAEKWRDSIVRKLKIEDISFDKLQERCSPAHVTIRGECFQDEPTSEGTVMPVIVPPIIDADQIEMKSLAIHLASTNPFLPLWRSNNFQQQIDDDMKQASVLAKRKQRLIDYATGVDGLVDNSKHFVIEITAYTGRCTHDTLPLEAKVCPEPKILYRILALNTNTVEDLRNAIFCDKDFIGTEEIQRPEDIMKQRQIAKERCPWWAMTVENFLYSNNSNFTNIINSWTQSPPKKPMGPFNMGNISTPLERVSLRLGYPYIFTHIGNCEHNIVFNNARLPHRDDEHKIAKYPVIESVPNLKHFHCRVDNENLASFAVLNCKQFPENPMLMCSYCLTKFCYNSDGSKRMPFALYQFRQAAMEI